MESIPTILLLFPSSTGKWRTRWDVINTAAAVDGGHGIDMFTAWVYDHLLPRAAAVKVAHPLMLRAIAAAK